MTKLEKIWTNTIEDRHELRIDWDNDRHQAIQLKGLDPESVERGLVEAAHLLAQERQAEHL